MGLTEIVRDLNEAFNAVERESVDMGVGRQRILDLKFQFEVELNYRLTGVGLK